MMRFFRLALLVVSLVGTTVATDGAKAARALGVVRAENSNGAVVSIDFDVPRYGPLCISVDNGDALKFVWEEYHNLHMLLDENSFENCDFSNAVALSPQGKPMPNGYTVEETSADSISYFSCSKICASNGHKVMVCRGGSFGEANECSLSSDCSSDRTLDVRETDAAQVMAEQNSGRDYLPVGRVCRPKNGDGYSIASGVDTPESCQKKCDDDSSRCGAWEFEDHELDNRECELHEIEVVSYEETLAMGDCQLSEITGEEYRCCWIAREIVEMQTETLSNGNETAQSETAQSVSGAFSISPVLTVFSIAMQMTLLYQFLQTAWP